MKSSLQDPPPWLTQAGQVCGSPLVLREAPCAPLSDFAGYQNTLIGCSAACNPAWSSGYSLGATSCVESFVMIGCCGNLCLAFFVTINFRHFQLNFSGVQVRQGIQPLDPVESLSQAGSGPSRELPSLEQVLSPVRINLSTFAAFRCGSWRLQGQAPCPPSSNRNVPPLTVSRLRIVRRTKLNNKVRNSLSSVFSEPKMLPNKVYI